MTLSIFSIYGSIGVLTQDLMLAKQALLSRVTLPALVSVSFNADLYLISVSVSYNI
jgi:hypothetical protein